MVAGGVVLATVASRRGQGADAPYREALVAAHRPMVLDPLLARDDPAVRDVGRLLYPGLLRLDDRALPVPDLASSFARSGDGLQYRFALASNLHWSDGSRLTSRDVAATIAAVQATGFPDAALAATWRGVAVQPGDGTVVLTLQQPRAELAAAVAQLPILPAAVVAGRSPAQLTADEHTAHITSGPFVVAASDADTLRLTASAHARIRPHLGTLELRLTNSPEAAVRALQDGSVDATVAFTPAQRAAAQKASGVHLTDVTTFRFVDLILNGRRAGLDDPAVRRALASGVDRAAIIRDALGGHGRPQVDAMPVGIAWVGAPVAEHPDPGLSRRALDAAGWVEGPDGRRSKDGQPLAFTMTVPDASPLPAVANALAGQLRALGVTVTVQPVPVDRFEHDVLVPERFDLALADFDNGPDPDVSPFWRSNATPPDGRNLSGLPADPFLDQALDMLATETDEALRTSAAARVNQYVADDSPAIFLYAPVTTFAISDAIQGVALPPVGTSGDRYDSITDWTR